MRSVPFGLFVAAFWMGLGLTVTEGVASMMEQWRVQRHVASGFLKETQTPALARYSAPSGATLPR